MWLGHQMFYCLFNSWKSNDRIEWHLFDCDDARKKSTHIVILLNSTKRLHKRLSSQTNSDFLRIVSPMESISQPIPAIHIRVGENSHVNAILRYHFGK